MLLNRLRGCGTALVWILADRDSVTPRTRPISCGSGSRSSRGVRTDHCSLRQPLTACASSWRVLSHLEPHPSVPCEAVLIVSPGVIGSPAHLSR